MTKNSSLNFFKWISLSPTCCSFQNRSSCSVGRFFKFFPAPVFPGAAPFLSHNFNKTTVIIPPITAPRKVPFKNSSVGNQQSSYCFHGLRFLFHCFTWLITIAIFISSNCYTSKENYKEKHRCLACGAFLLEFCISRTKKRNLIKSVFFLIMFGYLCDWTC